MRRRNVFLEDEVVEKLTAMGKKKGLRLAQMIRLALREWIEAIEADMEDLRRRGEATPEELRKQEIDRIRKKRSPKLAGFLEKPETKKEK